MGGNEIQKRLLEFITETFFVDEDEIDLDNSLVDDGIIDSFGLVEISAFLQRVFAITVPDEEMVRDNFGSVNKITCFVQSKAKASGTA